MLKADKSPRHVGRRIVIRLEQLAIVGRVIRFSKEPGNRGYTDSGSVSGSTISADSSMAS